MNTFFSFIGDFVQTIGALAFPIIFKLFLIIFVSFFLLYLIRTLTDKFIAQTVRLKRGSTLKQVIDSTSKVIISVIAFMMVLHEFGLDVRPILASAGILGLAISLGAQNLVKDIVNGFFILLEDQFGVGDTVKIGDVTGIVEKMNLRTTTLKDSNGSVHIIPNGEIKQVMVINH